MNNSIKSAITRSIAALTLILLPAAGAQAETHLKSKDLVLMGPRDLPEPAQLQGHALLLHSDNDGNTYLYVEQQEGALLSVFDVTDPARIKLAVIIQIPNQVPFDFVRLLGDSAELVYFRDSQKVGILDLHKAKIPTLRTIATTTSLATAEWLDESGFLASNVSYKYVPAAACDFQIIDISSASPTTLARVKGVKHRVTNDETGTTFLLGSDGLSVVRRLNVENEHKIRQMQTQGN